MEIPTVDLGRMAYAEALAIQREHHRRVLAGRREVGSAPGTILLVEHDPVITMSAKARRGANLLADREDLARRDIAIEETDRGGDITYHGPGQVVCYPILDLERLGIRLVDYLRLLERAIIAALDEFGLKGICDPKATGVWVGSTDAPEEPHAKIAAIGIRVQRWVTMHGLALNVDPDLGHFSLIVPCGLTGRAVTSMRERLGERCPSMRAAGSAVARHVLEELSASRMRE